MEKRDISSMGTPEAYFAASNSKAGFVSYFGACFDRPEIQKLYIIKGAPGTGKSRFMRDIAELSEQRGGRVKYYYCSSDPKSLDGITVRIGSHVFSVIDATLPHGYEPRLPGLREVIVDLGAFWDTGVLDAYREEIVALNDEKKYRFDMAYKYLRAAAELDEIAHSYAMRYADLDKIASRAKKILRHVPNGEEYSEEIGLVDSVGMLGCVRLSTFEERAERVYCLDDFCSLAHVLLDKIRTEAKEKRLSVVISPDPLFPDRLSALFIKETKSAFLISKKGDAEAEGVKHIDLKKLAAGEGYKLYSGKARLASRLKGELISSACEEFSLAKFCHFELENIYGSAMNFEAKEKFTREFVKGILKHVAHS